MRRFALIVLASAGVAMGAQPGATPGPNDGKFVPEAARDAVAEGNIAFAKKDYKRARTAYQRVVDLVPDNLVGIINLAIVENADGKYAEAEKLLKKAIQIKFDAGKAWLMLGTMYMDLDRLDEAVAALSWAVIYEPGNPRARNYLGVVIGRKGWYDGAQSELRKAVEIDPQYTDAHYNLAVFYLERKPPSVELARRHYYRAVELGAEKDPEIEKTLRESAAPSPTP